MATKSTNPQIVSPNSPLENLAMTALGRFGESSASTSDGETMLLFLSYANAIIDELHGHPYWDKGVEIPYYIALTDAREIPDTIMVPGLLARLAFDQGSKKAPSYFGEFYAAMNRVLANRKFGVGAEFSFQVPDVDGGGVS